MGGKISQFLLAIFFWAAMMAPLGVQAYSVDPNFGCVTDLWNLASQVFEGTCENIESTTLDKGDKQVQATQYTFTVHQVFKGSAVVGQALTFAQFGRKTPPKGAKIYIPAMGPSYQIGKRYVLFLGEESSLGLNAPVGLGRGVFSIREGKDGAEATLRNDINNRKLFSCDSAQETIIAPYAHESSSLKTHTKGPLDMDTFVTVLQSLQ